jgi:hypothetical protein
MSQNSQVSQTYYNHTTKHEFVKMGLVPPATVALKRVGNTFVYGMAICSRMDNYNKNKGRELAQERMNKGFGKVAIPEQLLAMEEKIGEKGICIAFLYGIANSLVARNKRWKRKVTKFNKEQSTRIEVKENQIELQNA